jgi:hypothetical protein
LRVFAHPQEGIIDSTTLLIVIVLVLVLGGGGFYGRGARSKLLPLSVGAGLTINLGPRRIALAAGDVLLAIS